jgi:uracil-DNA glycosylase
MMKVRIEPSWQELLQPEFDQPYFESLAAFVRNEYAHKTVYPPAPLIFNAFDQCPVSQVKVVILGAGSLSWSRTGTWLVFFGK